MSFGSGPGGCQSSANPLRNCSPNAGVLFGKPQLWGQTAAGRCILHGENLVLMSRIPQRDPARGSSCLSAWRQSRAYPSSGCCVWGHPLPSDTHWGTPASCISCYLVLPGSSSFLLLLHSPASNNWKDLVLTALRVWKPQKKNVAFVLYIVPFFPL